MCKKLSEEISFALLNYVSFNHPRYGKVIAYETDGFGGQLLMDDANVPSILSLPYLGA